jgi:hypothetical protein
VSAIGSRDGHARTETYLRLRAEAELRRVLRLPGDVDDMEVDDEGGPAELTAGEGLRRFSVVTHAHAALTSPEVSWYDLSETADIVSALDAVASPGAARAGVGRLVMLARRVGAPIPPALDAAPPADLPAGWQNILDNRDRGDGPFAVAAVLPELGGTRTWSCALPPPCTRMPGRSR